MRRMLVSLAAAAALLAVTMTAVHAQEAEAPDNDTAEESAGAEIEIRRDELKCPGDFTPTERIISGRDTASFRKEGTLLSKASREIPRVDQAGLLERKYAMYSGRRFHRSLTRTADRSDKRAAAVRRKLAAAAVQAPEVSSFGWFGWTLLTAIVVAVLVAWRMGWFVPFNVRAEAKKRALQVASGKHQSREAKEPRIKLIRRG